MIRRYQNSKSARVQGDTAAAQRPGKQLVMPTNRGRNLLLAVTGAVLLAATAGGQSMTQGILSPPASVRPPYLENVGIEQHLDGQVPADLAFVDDAGRAVKLGDYFGTKPLILNLVYYNCTMLCGEALAGLAGSMKMIKFDAGQEFEVVTVSFDPKETPAIAADKKQNYVKRYGRPGAAAGWQIRPRARTRSRRR